MKLICLCGKCTPFDYLNPRMIVCQKCGNKRCPHAEWHGYECTRSNELNQTGIVSHEAILLMNKD